MIVRLVLRRWRAFDEVALEFAPGTTFLVAPNGVGKTSLLMGLTWALFGDRSDVNARDCIRFGHDSAEAAISLKLSDQTQLTIKRVVAATGKTAVSCVLDDKEIDVDRAQQILVTEFGAPLEVAARLAVIRGSGKEDRGLDLSEHLSDAFGVSILREAADTAARLRKAASAASKALRSESKAMLANRDQLAQQAEELSRRLDDLANERQPLVERVRAAQRNQQIAEAWNTYRTAIADRSKRVEELFNEAAAIGVAADSLDDLAADLAVRSEREQSKADQARGLLADARAQQSAAQSALELLKSHDPNCPTCGRPFHGDELNRAVAAQRASLTAANSRIEAAERSVEDARAELGSFHRLQDSINEVLRGISEPEEPRPLEDSETALKAAEQALREHDEKAGGVSLERSAVLDQLKDDETIRSAAAAERAAWRREALTQATAEALHNTAELMVSEHIEPISQQVRWRWKALFGEDGLQLRADGSIVRVVGDRELAWEQLSSGEQIWARLVANLLILRSSTTLPFAWLDEPLEHLDPRARRIVATDLAYSTLSGQPAQLIVTTYEHDIARQLSEDVDSASIRFINRTEPASLPRPRDQATVLGNSKARVKT